MKDLFQWHKGGDTAWIAKPAAPRLTLGAFGKHPGWDDHILGIGVETETLAQVKQALYIGGIGGQIDSGAWEKLEPAKRLVGYDHAFLWLRPGHVILGQLWSSSDGKGRAKYPMVLCVDSEAISLDFVLTQLMPGLGHLREACKATTSADQVTKDCRAAQEQLRDMVSRAESKSAEPPLSVEVRRRFLERPEMGPDRLGFLRALHELGAGSNVRSRHLRLPLASDSQTGSFSLWSSFFRCAISDTAPLLLISRADVKWIDVLIGEPTSDDFFCLQASNKAIPLATEIPYQLPPESRPRYQALEAKFLGESSPVASGVPASEMKAEAPSPPGTAGIHKPARPRSKRSSLFIFVGGVVLLAAVAALWLSNGSGDATKAQARVAGASNRPISRPLATTEPQGAEELRKAVNSAQAAERAGNFTNALALYQGAQKLKQDDARVGAKIQELTPKAAEQVRLAEERAKQEQQAAEEFRRAVNSAQATEQAGNFTNALALYQEAQKLKREDAQVGAKIQELAPRAAEQMKLAEERAKLEQQVAEEFRRTVNSARAAEQAGNFTNALALYQGAQKLKRDDAPLGAKIQELTPKAAEQVRLAEKHAKMEQQSLEEFRKAVNSAQAAEQAGDFTNALALYQGAQKLKQDDAPVGAKIQELTPKAREQMGLAEERAKQEQQAAEEFQKAVNSAQAAEQAGNFTNALALYQGAQKLKQDDASVGAKLQELTPKAQEQLRKTGEGPEVMSAGRSGPETAAKLDAEFEKYLVWFGVLKPTDPRIQTPEARKEKRIVGQVNLQDADVYLKRIDYLRSEFEKSGRLNQNDRQKYLEKLRDVLLSQ